VPINIIGPRRGSATKVSRTFEPGFPQHNSKVAGTRAASADNETGGNRTDHARQETREFMNYSASLKPSGRMRPRALVTAAVLAATGAATVLTPTPAHAGMTGMQRCMAGLQPDQNWMFAQQGGGHVTFPAGTNPPNGIFPGEALHAVIDWTSWVDISYLGGVYNVNGDAAKATSGFPFPGWPKYADVFRMNNNPGGWVASGSDPNPWDPHMLQELGATKCFAAPALPVRMGVQINDDNLSDNTGTWTWTLQIWTNHL
jgi:hypothetical protein